jgi:hypothetical protein
MRTRLLLGLAAVAALGCGREFAPVSGKVTLNGQPVAGATVVFQPIAREGSIDAGPGSVGTTNDKGEYTLTADTGQKGAVVGKHRVMISSLGVKPGSEGGDQRGGPPLENRLPGVYNDADTSLTFDVPAGGTNKADFPLTTAPPP